MRTTLLMVIVLLCLSGCGMLELSDDQIQSIAKTTGQVVATATQPVIDPYIPGGAAAGGSAVSLLVGAVLYWLWGKKKHAATPQKKHAATPQ